VICLLDLDKKNEITLLLSVVIISILLIIRDVFDIEISKYIFVIIYLTLFITLSTKQSIVLLCFTTPLLPGLPGNYIIAGFLVAHLINNYNSIKISKYYIPIFVILIIELINMLYFNFDNLNVFNVLLSIIALTYIFTSIKNIEISFKTLSNYIIFGTIIMTFIVLVNTISSVGISEFLMLNQRIGVTKDNDPNLIRVSLNPNALGATMSFVYTIILIKINKMGISIYNVLLASLFVLVGLLTFSRTFVLVFIFANILYLINQKSFKTIFNLSLVIVLSFVLTFILFPQFTENIIENYLYRFTREDLTSSRDTIFVDYNHIFFSKVRYIFIGVGVDNYSAKYGYPYSAHNSLQEIYLVWGFTGFIFLVSLFCSIFKKIFARMTTNKLLYTLPFITILITSFAGQLFTSNRIYFIIISFLIMESYKAFNFSDKPEVFL